MDENELHQHLSRIQTHWTMVFQANQGPGAVPAAQRSLMERYSGAVYRYLLAIVHDPDRADDLAQEFALRFLRGDFRQVTPQRGRFRDFVKSALRNLVIDAYRRQQARPRPLPAGFPEPASADDILTDLDRQFRDSWRDGLLSRAWQALAEREQQGGPPWHTVLRLKAEHPEWRSAQVAEHLTAQVGKEFTADGVRKLLERARRQFADFLLDDIEHSLADATPGRLEEELADLGLREYCRPALDRRDRLA